MELPTESPGAGLARRVIGGAMKVHRALGCGFLESVYRNALAIELRQLEISFEIHPPLPVHYQGVEVGTFQADLIIDKQLIVELKAVENLTSLRSMQLINYLAAAEIEEGLLLNFGAKSLEFRTKTRTSPEKMKIRPPILSPSFG